MAEEKTNGKTKAEQLTKVERPKFRLRFARAQELGRSDLTSCKLLNVYGAIITPKFYSAHDRPMEDNPQVQLIWSDMMNTRLLGPREKYQEPILESQRYGWFQEKFLQSNNTILEKISFPKQTSEMVRVQNLLQNAEKANQLYNQLKGKKNTNKN